MSSGWFETVAVAQRRARKRLPKSVYWSIVAGSEQGATLKDNVAAFGELGFTPHAGGLPAKRDLATTVLGRGGVAFAEADFAVGFTLVPDFGFGAGFFACFLLVAIAADRP